MTEKGSKSSYIYLRRDGEREGEGRREGEREGGRGREREGERREGAVSE